VIDELGDLKPRTTNTEDALAGVNRRLDRLDSRMERIERRYGIAED
jgi:archaellum component FlaC